MCEHAPDITSLSPFNGARENVFHLGCDCAKCQETLFLASSGKGWHPLSDGHTLEGFTTQWGVIVSLGDLGISPKDALLKTIEKALNAGVFQKLCPKPEIASLPKEPSE